MDFFFEIFEILIIEIIIGSLLTFTRLPLSPGSTTRFFSRAFHPFLQVFLDVGFAFYRFLHDIVFCVTSFFFNAVNIWHCRDFDFMSCINSVLVIAEMFL